MNLSLNEGSIWNEYAMLVKRQVLSNKTRPQNAQNNGGERWGKGACRLPMRNLNLKRIVATQGFLASLWKYFQKFV